MFISITALLFQEEIDRLRIIPSADSQAAPRGWIICYTHIYKYISICCYPQNTGKILDVMLEHHLSSVYGSYD